MSIWKKLFGGSEAPKPAAEAIDYEGFRIIPQPMSEDGGFRICAIIEADVDGETRTHRLIRADVIRDADEAREASVAKAKQMIDQQGARIFS